MKKTPTNSIISFEDQQEGFFSFIFLFASVNPIFLRCHSMAGLFLPASANYQLPLLL